ncbi:MAG: DUF2934 domain-containing protein [Gemmatimonadetes bacterium]|nr:DUF2934 domain-containing protein [Gemmatimonadota bacterium]
MSSRKAPASKSTPAASPDGYHALVAERAYFIWMGRNAPSGDPEADWLEAERQLRSEAAPAKKRVGGGPKKRVKKSE